MDNPPPPQDPNGPPPIPGEQPHADWQPQQQSWPQQPGEQPAEPYPGYADTHADYYRRQQEAAQQAAIGPQMSANPLRHLGNWGLPPARPGLSPEEQHLYDSNRGLLKGKILRLVILMALLGIAGILGLIRTFT